MQTRPHPWGLFVTWLMFTTALTGVVSSVRAQAAPPSRAAEAARLGARLDWDVDRIRDDLERRSGKIRYTNAGGRAVVPQPTREQLAEMSLPQLFDLCVIWNPAIRMSAAGEIARRGGPAYAFIEKNVSSGSADRRVAAAQAIVGTLGHGSAMDAESAEWDLFLSQFPELVSATIDLFSDRDVSVRQAIAPAFDKVGRLLRRLPDEAKTPVPALAQAVLEQTASETGAHICQNSLITFSRLHHGWLDMVDQERRAELLGKALLQQPFPRGRSSAIRVIAKLDPEEIRLILPEILEVFRTPCVRDSMFFPGGREVAFKLIVEHGEAAPQILQEAIAAASDLNREPWVSLRGRHSKSMRVFWSALGDLGPRAAPVLPSFRALQREAKEALDGIADTETTQYARAKEIVDYADDIIERISQ